MAKKKTKEKAEMKPEAMQTETKPEVAKEEPIRRTVRVLTDAEGNEFPVDGWEADHPTEEGGKFFAGKGARERAKAWRRELKPAAVPKALRDLAKKILAARKGLDKIDEEMEEEVRTALAASGWSLAQRDEMLGSIRFVISDLTSILDSLYSAGRKEEKKAA